MIHGENLLKFMFHCKCINNHLLLAEGKALGRDNKNITGEYEIYRKSTVVSFTLADEAIKTILAAFVRNYQLQNHQHCHLLIWNKYYNFNMKTYKDKRQQTKTTDHVIIRRNFYTLQEKLDITLSDSMKLKVLLQDLQEDNTIIFKVEKYP